MCDYNEHSMSILTSINQVADFLKVDEEVLFEIVLSKIWKTETNKHLKLPKGCDPDEAALEIEICCLDIVEGIDALLEENPDQNKEVCFRNIFRILKGLRGE